MNGNTSFAMRMGVHNFFIAVAMVCTSSVGLVQIASATLAADSSELTFGPEVAILASEIIPVMITDQPTNRSDLDGGGPVTFAVGATGTSPRYQWYKNGNVIPGATNSSFTIDTVFCTDEGEYYVNVSNDAPSSVESAKATLDLICDTWPPEVLWAFGTNSTVIVGFDELTTNGNHAVKYAVFSADGSEQLPVVSAAYTSGTNRGDAVWLTLGAPRRHEVAYNLSVSGIADRFGAVMPPTTVPIGLFSVPLISLHASHPWRYDTSGTNRGSAWRQAGYDDSSWPIGFAVFDGKRGETNSGLFPCRSEINSQPVRTCITISNETGSGQIPAAYFRTHFHFSGNPGDRPLLALRTFVDDGAIFYLNGVALLHLRMPAGAFYGTLATQGVDTATFEGPFPASSWRTLVQGDNVLAVEVHQSSLVSADLTFAVELALVLPTQLRLEISSAGGQVIVTWPGPGKLQWSPSLSPPAWQEIEGAASSYRASSIGQRFFRLASE